MKKALLTGVAVLLLSGAAHATEDYCVETIKTRDGFVALREGPGTQYRMMAKLKPGFP